MHNVFFFYVKPYLDRVSYDLSEVPSIFLEPLFDLSKHEMFFTVFSNIFPTSDTYANVPMANIRISDICVQVKVIVLFVNCYDDLYVNCIIFF